MTTVEHQKHSEKGLARTAQSFALCTEKWFSDAYIFALAGVFIVAIAALANGSSPQIIVDSFGNGFWELTALPCRWRWWS